MSRISPENEASRLRALRETFLLDSPPEAGFDDLAVLAARLCATPIALVSLVDEDRQWFKAAYGLDLRETPRSQSFCAHALDRTSPLVVPDTACDPRFAENPLVTAAPFIRAYAGAPVVLDDGLVIGTLCVIDLVPREFAAEQLENLQRLARQVVGQIRLRANYSALYQSEQRLRAMIEQTAIGIAQIDLDGRWIAANPRLCDMLGYAEAELLALSSQTLALPEDRARDLELRRRLVTGEISSCTQERRYIDKQGRPIWTHFTLSLVKKDDGSPVGFGAIIEDITQRKRTETLLTLRVRQQEAISRLGLEASRTTSLDEIFRLATTVAAEALDLELTKVLQLSPDCSCLRLVAGVGWQRGRIGTATVDNDLDYQVGFTLLQDTPVLVDDFAHETRFRPPFLLEEHQVVSGMSTVIRLQGRPWGVLGVHSREARHFSEDDSHFVQLVANLLSVVIERLTAVREQAISEERLREAQRIARLGSWELDIASMRLSWSAEIYRIFGVQPGDFGHGYKDFISRVHPEDREAMERARSAVVSGGQPMDFEHRIIRPDGTVRHVRERGELVLSEDGAAVLLAGTVLDVTDLRADSEQMRLLDTCIAHLNDAVLITDLFELDEPGPRIIYANEAFERLSGYTRAESLGRSPRFLQGPKTQKHKLARIRAHLTRGEAVHSELINYTKSGGEYWVDIAIVPVPDHTGKLTRAVAIQRDITERKRGEDQQQRIQALLRMAGRTARLGAWSLHLADGTLTWSEETCRIHEVPTDFQPDLERALSFYLPKYRAMVTEHVNACLEAGEAFNFEAEILTAKGRRVWVRVVGEAIRDAAGTITGMEGAIQDITPIKLAERSLEESQRRFRELSESMPYIVWTAEPDGTVDYSNRCFFEYTGVAENTPPATRWQPCLHPDDVAASLQLWDRCIREEIPYSIEYRIRRGSDGEYRWFRVQATPVRDAEGRLIKWYGTGLDIDESKRLQRQATRLADRLTTTLESLTDAFIAVDPTWRFSHLNNQATKLLRRPREELLGQVIWDLFPEALGSTFERQYRKAVATGEPVTFEEYFAPLEIWFEVRAFPSVEGLAVYFQDVTERRRHRQSLRQSEERFRLLARATNDAIWDWNLLDDSLWWNDGLETLFGYKPSEVESNSASWEKRIHPDDHGRVMTEIEAVINSTAEICTVEYRFACKDGGYAYVLDRCYVIRDGSGKAVRMIGGMTDLSERLAAEERLREQATLLDKAQDAILVRDLDHRILYWNQSATRLYGWPPEEAVGRSVRDLLYRDDTVFETATAETIARGEWVGELEHYNKAGARITVEGHWTLVRDKKGNPKSILVINTDITERKKLESQFLRAQRMESIGTLAGGIAHDLNNLLSPIVMGVDLLRQLEPDTKHASIIDNIGESARRGTDLVKQVLSFARGVEGTRIHCHVDQMVREIVAIVSNTFPKNIRLDHTPLTDLWPVVGDSTQIHQVLLNLCVNARDAMPDGGCIRIATANAELDQTYAVMSRGVSAGRYVVITVSDEGCGMPGEIIDRVFEPFFTTKEQGKGSGLGLSTSLGIIRSHGGFINVYSEKNKGSVFKVYLPAQTEAAQSASANPNPESFPRGNGETILLVDDEVSILEITKQTLEAFGYRVLTAEDGAQAIAIFATRSNSIDLVLTDMMMPIMDGPALIASLYRVRSDVRVIAASGLNANGNVAKAANAGVKHFLPKPYSADRILNLIRTVLTDTD